MNTKAWCGNWFVAADWPFTILESKLTTFDRTSKLLEIVSKFNSQRENAKRHKKIKIFIFLLSQWKFAIKWMSSFDFSLLYVKSKNGKILSSRVCLAMNQTFEKQIKIINKFSSSSVLLFVLSKIYDINVTCFVMHAWELLIEKLISLFGFENLEKLENLKSLKFKEWILANHQHVGWIVKIFVSICITLSIIFPCSAMFLVQSVKFDQYLKVTQLLYVK